MYMMIEEQHIYYLPFSGGGHTQANQQKNLSFWDFGGRNLQLYIQLVLLEGRLTVRF